ncbi:MAG: hypothetical protein H0W24_01250 [Lysobacter sp.]|jgi:hypothetical protein|nr:hypothetical protein [Lysobacter sp.]MDQ3268922.1 hypothetical protein [Pseudomonadota bacterium]
MNRHIHNTLSALSASGAVLVLGLLAAAPLLPHHAGLVPPASSASTSAREVASEPAAHANTVAMIATAIDHATTNDIDAAPQHRTRSAQRRQALVMPYLSFVPRG